MQSQLEMNSGPRFVKPAILGAIALLFAGGIYALMPSGDETAATHGTDAPQQTAMAGDGNAAIAAESAVGAMPSAPAAAADGAVNADAAAPAPAVAAPAATQPVTAAPAAVALSAASSAPAPQAEAAPAQAAAAPSADERAAEPAAVAGESKLAAHDEQPSREAVRSPAAPAVDVLRPWWNTAAGDDRFGVEYVGQAVDQPALAIRFSRQVADPVAAQNIRLIGANGQPVAANWEPGRDPRVLLAPDLQPGRYTVVIDAQLASVDGQSLGTPLRGPTYIQ